ncbi:hypothetical protein ALC62_05836 [Cyphomyrmex costatus]|uniref:Uncharacterized protein n=1 Tax=Cyphomyrmex costatus TaxID=456900 RepID=A0A151IJT0_9HYME|nr:hypothetical protein ALC62_05836 [Cyphomyrmex costatus]
MQRGVGASKVCEAPPWNKRIMWTRFDVFEYLISPALKPSHHSRLTTSATIEVELMKDRRERERERERERRRETLYTPVNRLLPDAVTTMVRAAVLAAVLGQLLGPSVASRPTGAHPGHAYFEQPCCGRSHLRHHKERENHRMECGMVGWLVGWDGRTVAWLAWLAGSLTALLAGYGSRVLESIAGFPNGWKPRAIAEAKKKYYNRCYGGDSRQGQLMLRNGRTKSPGIAPPNDLYRRA